MLMKRSTWGLCGALLLMPWAGGGCVLEKDMDSFCKHVSAEDAATVQELDGCYLVTEIQGTPFYYTGIGASKHARPPEEYSPRYVTIRRFHSQQVLYQSSLWTPAIPPLPGLLCFRQNLRRHYHMFREGYRGTRQFTDSRVKMVPVEPGNPESDQAVADDADYWRRVIAAHVPGSDPLREQLRAICEKQMAQVVKANPDNGRYKKILMDLNRQAR